jgi:very-short-patch-repair endonuclease
MNGHISDAERELAVMLRERDIEVIPQQAVGPYNVDLGTFPIAVEVWGGAWHFSRDHTERFHYLLDRGWAVVIVYTDKIRSPLGPGAADYIAALIEICRTAPPPAGQYWVIRGSGELSASGRLDDDDVASVVPRERLRHTRP